MVNDFIDNVLYCLYCKDKIEAGLFPNLFGHIEQGKKDFDGLVHIV
jgi:hypothetical protein